MKDYTGVYELTADGDVSISEGLGISKERSKELEELMPQLLEKHDRVSETLEAIWNVTNHPNEFAWMAFIYGANIGVNQAKKTDFLKDLIDKFLKDMGEE